MKTTLFTPYTLRGVTFSNRVAMAPMCQYQAKAGVPQSWHLVHLGKFAQAGLGLIIAEATAVCPEGRITPACTGLYSDAAEAAWRDIVAFCHNVSDVKIGVQLAHAGRKASTQVPWEGGDQIAADDPQGWQVVAPSPLAFDPAWAAPQALDLAGIEQVIEDFAQAARRAAAAGFDMVEIHGAHGYLLHSFLSPLSNLREDDYGGTLENRMRLPLAVFDAVRAAFPKHLPVSMRFSALDWVEGGWDLPQSIAFNKALEARGCDMVHVSTGGLDPRQSIPVGPGYQVEFAAALRAQTNMAVMAVGQIIDPWQAETILRSGQADTVALARGLLWDPNWCWHAAHTLGAQIAPVAPYARSHPSLQRSTPQIPRS